MLTQEQFDKVVDFIWKEVNFDINTPYRKPKADCGITACIGGSLCYVLGKSRMHFQVSEVDTVHEAEICWWPNVEQTAYQLIMGDDLGQWFYAQPGDEGHLRTFYEPAQYGWPTGITQAEYNALDKKGQTAAALEAFELELRQRGLLDHEDYNSW